MLKKLAQLTLGWAIALALALPTSFLDPLHARVWSDASGRFKIDADLQAINDDVVVLKTKNARLIAVEIKQLSEADQTFLLTEAAGASKLSAKDKDHVWTIAGDRKLIGHIAGYFALEMAVERRNAKLMVDGTAESELPELLVAVLPKIVENFETAKIKDLVTLKEWLAKQGKVPHVYPLEGVRIALATGEEVKIPIFLFNSAERALLEPGLARWKALQKEKLEVPERSRYDSRETLMLSSAARAYQQDKAMQAQAQMMQLELLAVNAGVTDLWEVLLVPPNPYAYPFSVVVPARDSGAAQEMAALKYPGYRVDVTRKVAGF